MDVLSEARPFSSTQIETPSEEFQLMLSRRFNLISMDEFEKNVWFASGEEGKVTVSTVRTGHDSMVRTDGHTLSEKRNYQVTNSMFGASRKKFVEGVDSDYHDENMYYSQSSMFPHRSEKDKMDDSFIPDGNESPSSEFFNRCTRPSSEGDEQQHPPVKSQLVTRHSVTEPRHANNRGTNHVTSHASISKQVFIDGPGYLSERYLCRVSKLCSFLIRGILPMNPRNMMNHSQVGQGIGIPSRTNSMSSSGLGSPSRSSPSIICMPKQQPSRQPFTVNRLVQKREAFVTFYQCSYCISTIIFYVPSMSGFGMNRNQAFGMNNSLSSNIFNGTVLSLRELQRKPGWVG
ncbi:hypothetical protein HPG69_014868 [Diceros bicornis minor]|uniref:Uncharacterized protein n=1 Tax=Diceros bicornis minor TaxID=77932 RepID=A0A7J7FJL6_DICBM|nr:hypothetical protein HPG69_014868 [Diceros bicornis minor]